MKKLILFLALLIALPLVIFAQDVPAPPTGWGDIITNPGKWFADFGAVAVLTAFIAAFFNGLLKVTKPFLKQLLAWGVGLILVVGSDLLNFGYAAEYPILFAVVNGFAVGLASNGLFDIPLLKGILNAIEGWFKPKPTP
jgi:hypothetical protein